jgi:hypothetical protein
MLDDRFDIGLQNHVGADFLSDFSFARLVAQGGDDGGECRRAKGWLMLKAVFDVSFCFCHAQLALTGFRAVNRQ